MFKGSRGVRLQYRKKNGGYDYVQPVILPNGEKILVHGNTLEGCPIDAIAEVDLKRASDLNYVYSHLVGREGYLSMSVVQQWDRLLEYSRLLED